jgi:site-specific DNA recombinase
VWIKTVAASRCDCIFIEKAKNIIAKNKAIGCNSSKDTIIRQYKTIIKTLTDTSALAQEHARQQSERDVVEGLIRRLIAENAQVGLDLDEYTRREADLVARYDTAKTAMTDTEAQIQERKNRRTKLAAFIRTLEKQDGLITTFDERLWNATVESVTVYLRERIVFTFRGGMVKK